MQQILKSLLKIKDAKEKIRTGLVDSNAQNWPASLLPDWRKMKTKPLIKAQINRHIFKQYFFNYRHKLLSHQYL